MDSCKSGKGGKHWVSSPPSCSTQQQISAHVLYLKRAGHRSPILQVRDINRKVDVRYECFNCYIFSLSERDGRWWMGWVWAIWSVMKYDLRWAVCVFQCVSHGCQLSYRWPGTLPSSVSLSDHTTFTRDRQATAPITELSWLQSPFGILAGKTPTVHCPLLWLDKGSGMIGCLIAPCRLWFFSSWKCFSADMLRVVRSARIQRLFYDRGVGQRKVHPTLKLRRRSKMESWF